MNYITREVFKLWLNFLVSWNGRQIFIVINHLSGWDMDFILTLQETMIYYFFVGVGGLGERFYEWVFWSVDTRGTLLPVEVC